MAGNAAYSGGPDEPGPPFSYVLKHIQPFGLNTFLTVLGSETVVLTKLYLPERKLPISPYLQIMFFLTIPADGLQPDDSL
jgi:hypothetical protein